MTTPSNPTVTINIERDTPSGPGGETTFIPPEPPELGTGRFFMAASQIRSFSLPDLERLPDLPNMPAFGVEDISISRDGRYLAAVQSENLLTWDLATNTFLGSVSTDPDELTTVSFNATGTEILCGTLSNPQVSGLYRFAFPGLTPLSNPIPPDTAETRDIRYSPDNRWISMAKNSTRWEFYDNTTNPPTSVPSPFPPTAGSLHSVDFSRDNLFCAAAYPGFPYLRGVDAVGSAPFELLDLPTGLPSSLTFRKCRFSKVSDRLAVVGGESGRLVLLDTSTPNWFAITEPPQPPLNSNPRSVAWSDQSDYLAVGLLSPPYVVFYSVVGDVFTPLILPGFGPTNEVTEIAYTPFDQPS